MSKNLLIFTVEPVPDLCRLLIGADDLTTVSIADIYWHYCPKVRTDGFGKVRLLFDCPNMTLRAPEEVGDVIDWPAHLDVEQMLGLEGIERRRFVSECIHAELLRVCERYGWNPVPFHEAMAALEANGFAAYETSTRKVWSPGREWWAKTWWSYNDKIKVGLLFGGREAREVVLMDYGPGIGGLEEVLGGLRWESATKVQLMNRNERDWWLYDLETPRAEFIYGPAAAGDPKGEYDLARMYLKGRIVPKDLDKARKWLERSASKGFGRAVKELAEFEKL